jgi:hypothetical protein
MLRIVSLCGCKINQRMQRAGEALLFYKMDICLNCSAAANAAACPAVAGTHTPRNQMLSAEDALFRSPMQFGLSRMPDAVIDSDLLLDGSLPRVRVRPGGPRSIAAQATQGWGK